MERPRAHVAGRLGKRFVTHCTSTTWHDLVACLQFVNGFGDNEDEHEDRITFVVEGESKLVGVTTAWYHTDPKGTMALVHYVAMLPECTGQGLSTPLMSAVLKRHHELGHTECRLGTSTGRLAAINLYVKFGFLPLLNPEDPAKAAVEYRAWRELQPLLRETFAVPFGPTPLWRPPAVAARL